MDRRKLFLCAAVTALCLITGCSGARTGDNTDVPAATENVSEAVVIPEIESIPPGESTGIMKKAVNSFNWDIYDRCGPEGNLFYSPYCIVSAMALADLGAAGNTKEEIEKALCIEDYPAFLGEFKGFNEREQSGKAYLNTANGIFIDSSLKLSSSYEEAFKDPAKACFNGEFRNVDFKNDPDGAKNIISSWVSDATGGMIPDYDPGATKDTVADILSAVYFYGEWQSKFTADSTFPEAFHGTEGDREVDTMHMAESQFRYVEDENGITAIALPYEGGQYEMDILMQADNGAKESLVLKDKDTAEEVLNALDNAMITDIYTLALPKFRLDLKIDGLKEKLESMGIKTLFTENADLSGLAKDIMISDICHRAVVEVDEEGSRAAAVTEVMACVTSVMEEDRPRIEFIVDKPFIFLIRDRESGVILFTGRINNI